MEFLFRDRGQGKRQVKVSQDIALLEDQIGGESSDDSEFKFNEDDEDGGTGSSSGSASGSDDDDDDDDDEDSSAEGSTMAGGNEDEVTILRHDKLTTQDLLSLCRKELASLDSASLPVSLGMLPKICGCCLGESSSDANEIVECDGCGIAVHEGCYGIGAGAALVETGSISSTVSSASTEPWFCEPCRAGLSKPPNCELCPVVGGVYKETDVGRWVHLVCALYTPGVAFGDPEKLMNATIFEMNYASWGRRVCTLCSLEDVVPASSGDGDQVAADEDVYQLTGGARLARTGVCIQCDAGMCKSFFHVTCAQAAGFLSEPAFVTHLSVTMTPSHMDSYLAHCKLHSDKTIIKQRRRTFLAQLAQTRLRRKEILDRQTAMHRLRDQLKVSSKKSSAQPDESADERIWRKLLKSQERYSADKKLHHDPWLPTQKMPRLLTTSAGALRKIQRLTTLNSGVDAARQQIQEIRTVSIIDSKKKWHIPPAFSVEFVAYYEDRQRRIDELKSKVNEQMALHSQLKREQTVVRPHFDKVVVQNEASLEANKSLRSKIALYRSVLGLGGTLPGEDRVPALKPIELNHMQPVTPSLKARSTVYAMQHQMKYASSSGSKVSLNTCGICKKSHDQHMLAHCDTCRLHYHLSCLTPPLTRMPKKSKLFGWSCSECYPESSSDEAAAGSALHVDDESRGRKRKRRSAASRALILTMADAANFSGSDDFEYDWQAGRQGQPPHAKKPKLAVKVKKPKMAPQPDPAAAAAATQQHVLPVTHNHVVVANANLDQQSNKAVSKAERKLLKKAEKERRKMEKKHRKKKHTSGGSSVVEIPPSTVKTSPILLKIKTAGGGSMVASLATDVDDAGAALVNNSNGHTSSNDGEDVSDDQKSSTSSKARRSSVGSSTGSKQQQSRSSSSRGDVRTRCDKCDTPGSNSNLVRCDECKRCFHFGCLIPPVRKSPKVAGYSWHCENCDPSDRDSDWHLD